MNIALCSDNNYTIPCLVSIISILENNKSHQCKIYVLTDGLSEANMLLFKKLSSIYERSIHIINVDISTYSNLEGRKRYPTVMYSRFLRPKILKE